MHERRYFDNHKHPSFKDFNISGPETLRSIEYFIKLKPHYKVVVIGCGYGRDTLQIAPHVGHVYGIDVSDKILDKACRITADNGIHNFTPVLADTYRNDIPEDIDLVFSIVVIQHITRDLTHDYFNTLEKKLSPTGVMVVQFLERTKNICKDADLRVYEPGVTWTNKEICELAEECNLTLKEIRTIVLRKDILHHWAYFVKGIS